MWLEYENGKIMIDFNYLMSTGCFYSYLKRNIIAKHEYVILIQRKN